MKPVLELFVCELLEKNMNNAIRTFEMVETERIICITKEKDLQGLRMQNKAFYVLNVNLNSLDMKSTVMAGPFATEAEASVHKNELMKT